MPQERSVDILIDKITKDAALADQVRLDPIAALRSLASDVKREHPPSASQDYFTYRLAVIVLSLVILSVTFLIGGRYLFATAAIAVPEILVAIGSTALGALAGLLTPQTRGSS